VSNSFEASLLALAPLRLGSLSSSPRGWEVILWSGPIGYSTYGVGHGLTPSEALASAQSDLRTSPHSLDCNEPKASYSSLSALFSQPKVPFDFKKRI